MTGFREIQLLKHYFNIILICISFSILIYEVNLIYSEFMIYITNVWSITLR